MSAFRFVVIDSAPILPFVDGRALSTLVDAVILVGRAGVTTRQAMRRSVELICGNSRSANSPGRAQCGADTSSADYKHTTGTGTTLRGNSQPKRL